MPTVPTCAASAFAALMLAACTISALSSAARADDCARPEHPPEARETIAKDELDQAVFSKAVLRETNYERCLQELEPLQASPKLRDVAEKHGVWMAETGTLSHQSAREGRRTPADRLSAAGIDYRRMGENLAMLHLYRLDETGRVRVDPEADCRFLTEEGKVVSRHTYASLADLVVQQWMDSEAHRKNLLGEGFRRHGAAFGVNGGGWTCGELYITQLFRG